LKQFRLNENWQWPSMKYLDDRRKEKVVNREKICRSSLRSLSQVIAARIHQAIFVNTLFMLSTVLYFGHVVTLTYIDPRRYFIKFFADACWNVVVTLLCQRRSIIPSTFFDSTTIGTLLIIYRYRINQWGDNHVTWIAYLRTLSFCRSYR